MFRLALLLSFTLIIATVCGTRFKRNYQQPQMFAPHVISTANDEFGATFSPDGNTCFFTVKSPSTLSSNIVVICYSNFANGKWSEPSIASFSGTFQDFNPCISPDGSKLFFISNRPVNGTKKSDTNIWMCEKKENGWSNPVALSNPVNTQAWELGCSVANDGTMYFSTTTAGNPDLYSSKLVNGKYQKPESLGDSINTLLNETDPFIAPDQSYILFASTGREDVLRDSSAGAEYPRGDLYISFNKNGKWAKAKNLGPQINSFAEESNPFVSHDGKTLYFTSERNFISLPMKEQMNYSFLEDHLHNTGNGLGDIYKIPIDNIFKKLQ